MNALLPIETVAEKLRLSTRSVYRLEREGKLARRATQPGEHPCWTEAAITAFQDGSNIVGALIQQDIMAMRSLIIPCGDSDLAIRQLLRAALKMEPHTPEAEVLDAVLTLQAQRDALHRDYEAANRKLRLWATALRHIKKTVDDTLLDISNE
jgi:hypothetical protein